MNAKRISVPGKRIGILANSVWNILHFRGPVVDMWEDAGCKVIVLVPKPQGDFTVPPGWSHHQWVFLHVLEPYGMGPLSLLQGYREMRRVLKEMKLDQLYSFTSKPNILSVLAARGMDMEVIPTVTGLGSIWLAGGWRQRLLQKLYRFSFKGAKTVIFHNSVDYDLFVQSNLIAEGAGIVIRGSGIDPDHYSPTPKPEDLPFTVLYLGRYLVDKGLRELVQAAREVRQRHPEIRFLFIGKMHPENPFAIPESELRSWIQEGIVECKDQQHDVRKWITVSDLVVLPSWREGTPRSLLEAMSMERPVITTDAPGCRQLMEHGEIGWLVPVQDPAALVSSILEAFHSSSADRRVRGRLGRFVVLEHYSEALVIQEYRRLLRMEPVHV